MTPAMATVRADCSADRAGTLTFDLTAPAPAPDSVLLLRRRGAAGGRPGGAVRIPLSRPAPGTRAPAPGVLATPCYTSANDLCLRLEPGPANR